MLDRQMDDFTGLPISETGVLVSREVRWFHEGALPDELIDWFTEGGEVGLRESRADTYDMAQARRGIGLKYRGGQSYDAKHLMSTQGPLMLGGFVGQIEDWLKVSHPIGGPQGIEEPVVVEKQIFTRRYVLGGETIEEVSQGCDVELSSIRFCGQSCWSFALETFGHPSRRGQALQGGLAQLLEDIPLPEGLVIASDVSSGYPRFLAERGGAPGGRLLEDVDGPRPIEGWFGNTGWT